MRSSPEMADRPLYGAVSSAGDAVTPAATRRWNTASAAGIALVAATAVCALVVSLHGNPVELFQTQPPVSFVDVSAQRRGLQASAPIVSFEDLSAKHRMGRTTDLVSQADPVPAGHVIHIDMPKAAMDKLKVGSLVKGKVREPMLASGGGKVFNTLDFTGKVRSLQMITVQGNLGSSELGKPDEGVVSIKLLSDQYLAPGTSVTGTVAGKIFKGTVTKAPSLQDRLDEADKRVREMAPPVCDEFCELQKSIHAAEKRIEDFKASRKMRKEAAALEKRVDKIEHPPPPPETVAILGNWAGFKFDLPQGPDVYGPRIKDMKSRLQEIPKGYVQAVEPLYEKTRDLEKKLDELEGLKTVRERIDLLRHELGDAELCTQYVDPQEQATPEDLEDRKHAANCIEHVLKSNKFKTFAGHSAEEEKEKEQFLKPEPIDLGEAGEEAGGGGAEEGGEEEGAAEKGRTQALRARRSKREAWAPGQKKVWEAYLAKTDKMNGVSGDEDNVIAQWA